MNLFGLFQSPTGIKWPIVLLTVLLVTVVAGFGIAGSTSTAAFDPTNPSWDGTGEFDDDIENNPEIERELVRDTTQYDDIEPDNTVAFIVSPDEEYDDGDAERVRQFLERGGSVVILDNFGSSGNELLESVGAEARTNGQLVLDVESYNNGPAMPVATGVETHSRTDGVDELALNHATAVEPGNATVLIETSNFAYLGTSPDDELEADSDLRSYPVATVESVEEGEVILVGDPSITINSMYEESDNSAFLAQQYTDREHVLMDISHTNELPPLTNALLTIRSMPVLQGLIGGSMIAAIALVLRREGTPLFTVGRLSQLSGPDEIDRSETLSSESRVAYLRREHPEWDEDRIQRVIRALNKNDSKERINERDGWDKSKR
ncbi:DUF4350 domain-containing protein [Halostagnicola sp. A-GB9-2]|uniref:DUF4350 domain-containing protein n=1 Tax=Halostagnicola sp. A-GB9-2 TaxID=3048066 RepID=UPI0024C032D4|nr:DUF4350 domain-containing protein [Halostagnicola sp. A-GB9-2]MDJ1434307.1 DUF4350 domain-containing protein [Halostagnicola sp. A-GB9-2]